MIFPFMTKNLNGDSKVVERKKEKGTFPFYLN